MAAVLVVEDDAGVRDLVVLILKQKGYDVLSASNGVEGLMVYYSYRSHVDLVLTDIDMPQMNGLELVTRIRTADPSKKILIMSGRAPDDFDGRVACPILSKPFGPNQLLEAVDGILKT